MDIDEYVDWARGTASSGSSADGPTTHLAILALSLLGDAGEVADLVKKQLRDGVLDRDRLANELGDVLYYWAQLCAVTGMTPSKLLEQSRHNIDKRLAGRKTGS